MFTCLKNLEISFLDFHISQKFLDSLYNLKELEFLTLCVKKFDVNLFNKTIDKWTCVSDLYCLLPFKHILNIFFIL